MDNEDDVCSMTYSSIALLAVKSAKSVFSICLFGMRGISLTMSLLAVESLYFGHNAFPSGINVDNCVSWHISVALMDHPQSVTVLMSLTRYVDPGLRQASLCSWTHTLNPSLRHGSHSSQ